MLHSKFNYLKTIFAVLQITVISKMSQSQSNIENTSIDNEKEEIYLSLCIQNKTTGGSFYDAKTKYYLCYS